MAGNVNLHNPLYHPSNYKKRFCSTFPSAGQCRRGATCAFAHTREEARTPLFSVEEEQKDPTALTEEFFMYKFKTLWCPIGVQHDWQTCVYAHNYQDARRRVDLGYGARPCPYWSKKDTSLDYSQRCPLGLRCPYSHGAKEQLYHPTHFRTAACRDLSGPRKVCPRKELCVFFHRRQERRTPPFDDVDYEQPLSMNCLDDDWVEHFLSQPFPCNDVPGATEGTVSGGPSMAQHFWGQPACHGGGRGGMIAPPGLQLVLGDAIAGCGDIEEDAEEKGSPRTQSTASGSEAEGPLGDILHDDAAWPQAWPGMWPEADSHGYASSARAAEMGLWLGRPYGGGDGMPAYVGHGQMHPWTHGDALVQDMGTW